MKIVATLFCFSLLYGCSNKVSEIEHSEEDNYRPSRIDVAGFVMPYVYTLLATDESGEQIGQGSGFLWDKGYLVTNAHVVVGASKVEWFSESGEISGVATYAVFIDVDRDIAILPWPGSVGGLRVADRAGMRGDAVYAFGAPMGLDGSMSNGIISAWRNFDAKEYIQTTAAISHGSSGGPLVDEDGDVLGVVTAFIREGQNLNLAVPSDFLESILIDPGKKVMFPAGIPDEDLGDGVNFLVGMFGAEEIKPNNIYQGNLNEDSLYVSGEYLKIYRIEARKNQLVRVLVNSDLFSPGLVVLELNSFGEDEQWMRFGDAADGTEARLSFNAPSNGAYYVLVLSADGSFGEYGIQYALGEEIMNERWKQISASDGDVYYLDTRSINRSGINIKAWVMADYENEKYLAGPALSYSKSIGLWEIQCYQRQLRINEIAYVHNGENIHSERVNSYSWINAMPGTIGEAILDSVCLSR